MRPAFHSAIAIASVALAATQIAHPTNQRELLREAERRFPERGWPRGAGHVVYAWPGTKEEQKGYAEPGGSFSPVVRSFGVSIEDGDRIPLAQVKQRFAWVTGEAMPVLVTETPKFESHLLCDRPGHWTDLVFRKEGGPVNIAIRSVGPAGGPITSLQNIHGRLLINGRWIVRFDPPPRAVRVFEEGPSDEGWWRADVTLAPKATLEINDPEMGAVETLPFSVVRARVKVHDPQMQDALDAEVAHLMMSLVGKQTRAADPLMYPFAWLTDGAYVVVALARAGQVDTAKQLALFFAQHDFFGGLGSEADGPGLALWAIGETADVAHSHGFDAQVWDSLERKAKLIVAMRHATGPMKQSHYGSVVPSAAGKPGLDLICEAAHDGLIAGKGSLLYVNAVSFLGLNEAARMAKRQGRSDLATSWLREARAIREAWSRTLSTAMRTRETEDDRTFTSALWPSHVGDGDFEVLRPLFEAQWKKRRTTDGGFREWPIRTYFDVAEAHNWLRLGNRERAAETLHWLFENQSSPGLYTWWESGSEDDSFHRWDDVRGWAHAKNVTPHYWTAAEMVLLQLEL